MIYVYEYLRIFLKYLFVTNVLDVGYSASRDLTNPCWTRDLFRHLLFQAGYTALTLYNRRWIDVMVIIALEMPLLALSTLVERQTLSTHIMRTYLFSELIMVLGYALAVLLIAIALPPYPINPT
jgi:hypothetical protein